MDKTIDNRSGNEAIPTFEYYPADFLPRAGAFFIDLFFLRLFTFPVKYAGYLMGPLSGGTPVSGPLKTLSLSVGVILILAITFIYYGYNYKKYGATIGKRHFKLRVINVKTGKFLGYQEAFFRDFLGKILSSILFFGGYIMMLFRKDKKTLHDLLTDTIVLQTDV